MIYFFGRTLSRTAILLVSFISWSSCSTVSKYESRCRAGDWHGCAALKNKCAKGKEDACGALVNISALNGTPDSVEIALRTAEIEIRSDQERARSKGPSIFSSGMSLPPAPDTSGLSSEEALAQERIYTEKVRQATMLQAADQQNSDRAAKALKNWSDQRNPPEQVQKILLIH